MSERLEGSAALGLLVLALPLAALVSGCPGPSTTDEADADALIARLPDARLLLDLPAPSSTAGRAPGDPSTSYAKTVGLTDEVDDTTGPVFSVIAEFVVTYESEDQEVEAVSAETTDVGALHWTTASVTGAAIDLWILEGDGQAQWLAVRSQGGQLLEGARGTMNTDAGEGSIEGDLTNDLGDATLTFPSLDDVVPPSGRTDPFAAVAVDYASDATSSTISATIDLPDDTFDRARALQVTKGEGGGQIDLVLRADVVGDADAELLAVRTQWTNDSGGRVDASVCEEPCIDLATNLLGTLSDCFDANGITTWISRSWNGNSEGDPSTCVFAESLPAQEVVDELVE